MKVSDIGNALSNLVRALDNRLTALENWGPEGEKFQVLTSRGPRDVDAPPTFMDIRDILQGISEQNGGETITLPGVVGPPGPAGADGQNGMVPTFVAVGETFLVPESKQALFAVEIDVEGILDVEGELVEVN